MAVRTSASAVGDLIEVDSTISLTPFIETAAWMVDRHLVTATQVDGTTLWYDSTDLELIERWLAAHFYAIRDQRADSEKAGPVSEKKQYKVDLGFNQTIYGQQAMRLDESGILASLDEAARTGGKRQIDVSWMGETYT